MLRIAAILSTFIALAGPAQAAAPCGGFASLGLRMGRCEDNAELGEAALACVRAYRDKVKAAQAEVLDKFQAEIEKMKREQGDSFDRTLAGYENARKTLRALIAEGHRAHLAVEDLYYNLYFPSDADAPEVTGMSHDHYLASEECFATPKNVLNQSKAMITHMRTQLEQLEQLALNRQQHSGSRSANVQALEPPKKTDHTVGQGSGKPPAARQPAQTSDISGTRKAIDDARKGGAKASEPPK